MSAYYVDKLCRLLQFDIEFRERLQADFGAELTGWPLTDEERGEFIRGDVSGLYGRGVHPLSLRRMQAYGPWQLSEAEFSRRIRQSRPL